VLPRSCQDQGVEARRSDILTAIPRHMEVKGSHLGYPIVRAPTGLHRSCAHLLPSVGTLPGGTPTPCSMAASVGLHSICRSLVLVGQPERGHSLSGCPFSSYCRAKASTPSPEERDEPPCSSSEQASEAGLRKHPTREPGKHPRPHCMQLFLSTGGMGRTCCEITLHQAPMARRSPAFP
jgi:hypothetical protein